MRIRSDLALNSCSKFSLRLSKLPGSNSAFLTRFRERPISCRKNFIAFKCGSVHFETLGFTTHLLRLAAAHHISDFKIGCRGTEAA